MKNDMSEYFNHNQQYYRFIILKKINEKMSIKLPIEIEDPELIEAMSKVHINNLIDDGFLKSEKNFLILTTRGKIELHRHYIDYQINLIKLSETLGDFYSNKISWLKKEVEGGVALYGASDTLKSFFNFLINAEIDLKCVIDDNPKKQKSKYLNLPVISTKKIKEFPVETIIISTVEFELEIKQKILEIFGDKYKIITLFN
tara:strand:- start:210 stop:812 length:603 start_codon:yes stop_codon:yes gene_type:complete